jgi:hypothetical protein
VTGNFPLELTPTTTVFTGTARLGHEGMAIVRRDAPGEEFGFFLPEVPPWKGRPSRRWRGPRRT